MDTFVVLLNWVIKNRRKLQELLKYYAPKFIWGYMIGMIAMAKDFGFLRMPLFFLSYIAYCLTVVLIKVDYDILFAGISSSDRTWLKLKLIFFAIGCGWAAYIVLRYF
jgi:hypothetical protein